MLAEGVSKNRRSMSLRFGIFLPLVLLLFRSPAFGCRPLVPSSFVAPSPAGQREALLEGQTCTSRMFSLSPPSSTFLWEGKQKKKDQLPVAFQKQQLWRNSKCHFWTFSTRPLARPNKCFILFYLFKKMLQLNANCVSVVIFNMICFVKPVLFNVLNTCLYIVFSLSFLLLLSLKQIKCKFVERSPGQIFQGTWKKFIGWGICRWNS